MKTLNYNKLDISGLKIEVREIYLSMGYRDHVPEQPVRDMVIQVLEEAQTICIPRYMYCIEPVQMVDASHLASRGQVFHIGKIIASYLSGISHACWFTATAGLEYDQYIHQLRSSGDIVKEFIADAIGSVIAEACVSEIDKLLNAESGFRHTLPYSPGYCGWNIQEQQKLFALFPDRPCGISLNASCLMTPVKSVSGFFGLGEVLQPQPYRCDVCSNKNCFKKREVI